MKEEASVMTEHERRLNAVVGAFLEAGTAGQALDRQALVAANPDLASELRAFFADFDRLQHLARPLRAVAEAASPEGHARTLAPCGQSSEPWTADGPRLPMPAPDSDPVIATDSLP